MYLSPQHFLLCHIPFWIQIFLPEVNLQLFITLWKTHFLFVWIFLLLSLDNNSILTVPFFQWVIGCVYLFYRFYSIIALPEVLRNSVLLFLVSSDARTSCRVWSPSVYKECRISLDTSFSLTSLMFTSLLVFIFREFCFVSSTNFFK